MAIHYDPADGARSIGSLLRDLAGGATELVRDEIRLARMELREVVKAIGVGTGYVAVGGVLLLLGALTLLTGIIMLAGDQWLDNEYWLAALILTVVLLGLTWWMAARGKSRLEPEKLKPDQTVATLREDKEWLKRQLTSDATSR